MTEETQVLEENQVDQDTLENPETPEVEEDQAVEETSEVEEDLEVAAILDTENPEDEAMTALEISMRDLKLAIRSGQFSDEEIAAIIKEGVISQDVVDVLIQNPLELKPKQETNSEAAGKDQAGGGEEKKKKPVKSEAKKSVTGQVAKKIQDILLESPVGLTIEEICVHLGVLAEDADPTDSDAKAMKKKYRTFARKAVDGHPEGSRSENLGRNRLYSIGEVAEREMEETVEEPEA